MKKDTKKLKVDDEIEFDGKGYQVISHLRDRKEVWLKRIDGKGIMLMLSYK